MRIVAIIICLWSVPVYALTVNEHAADSSNPHGAKMKITEKLNVGTGDDYTAGFALKVEGGATIDSLNLGGGNLTFGTASSQNGSLSIGTTTAGSSRIRVIGTITATTFVGDGTFLTGVGAGTGSGNWTDTGSSTQTLYPDTVTRKVAVGSTTTNGNQFAVDGTARIYGTLTATKIVGVAFPDVTGSVTSSQLSSNLSFVGTTTINNVVDFIGITLPGTPAAGIARLSAQTENGFTRITHLGESGVAAMMARDNIFTAKNTSGSTITKGQVVYVTGSVGAVPTISLAKGDAATTSKSTIGIAITDVNNNAFTGVMLAGILEKINTSSFTAGDVVYVSPTTAGNLTNVKPVYPNYIKGIGTILNSGVGNGSILINVAPFLGNTESGTDVATYTFGGNVGVGTTTPATTMQVIGTITASSFTGNGAGLTGISSTDVKWTDTGEALQPGTITYKLRLGTTTANGATLQVEGSATVGGTLSAMVVIANAPDGETEDAIANAGQLASIKAEMLTEIIDHTVATSDIHGVGESTIASMASVATVSAYAITQYGSLNNTSFGSSSTTSSFTVEADSIKLIDASNHALIVTGVSVTNTITTAGPAAGGRDQAAAFGANDWIYFYWISTGTVTSSVSSLSYPSPVLPTNYTHWCLAAIVKSSGSALKTGYMRGNTFHYEGRQTVVTSQTNTTESTISLSSFIPPEAIDWIGELELGITNSVPSTSQARYNLRLVTGVNYCRPLVNTDAPGLSNWQSQFVLVPNMNQSIITRWTDDNGNSLSGNIYLNSYSIPNGGM